MVGYIRVGSDRLNIFVPKDRLFSVMVKTFHGFLKFFGFWQTFWTEKAVNGKHFRVLSLKIRHKNLKERKKVRKKGIRLRRNKQASKQKIE